MGNTWEERDRNFEDRPVRTSISAAARVGIVIGAVMVIGGGLGVAHWGFGVFTSDVKGQGDAVKIKNDAKNRIRAQEGFWDKYQAVVVADRNLTTRASLLAKDPDNLKLQTEVVGLQQICISAVGTYNAASQKFTQAEFKDAELPHQIDDTSAPEIDCKEK